MLLLLAGQGFLFLLFSHLRLLSLPLSRLQVLTAYTVRACQGRSQSLQLRRKAPGRMSAGAALRVREGHRLLDDIALVGNEAP